MTAKESQPSAIQTQLGLQSSFIRLQTKPGAQISFDFITSSADAISKPHLIIFLNGLGLPKAAWLPVISEFVQSKPHGRPAILAYDRYGQGTTTDMDPADEGAPDPMHAHDCISVVRDLHQLIKQITRDKMGIEDIRKAALIFVANSIGCAIGRLYAQEYSGTVAGLLLLDSVLANSDFVSIIPDPDDEKFDKEAVPSGITVEMLKQARQKIRMIFHPDNGSKEGLSRKNLKTLLEESDSPVLRGVNGRGPYVTVVGHDFTTFAEQSEKQMGIPKIIGLEYSNPYWNKYNQGLSRITEPERSKGPIQAPDSGHFIQADNPTFVVQELSELVILFSCCDFNEAFFIAIYLVSFSPLLQQTGVQEDHFHLASWLESFVWLARGNKLWDLAGVCFVVMLVAQWINIVQLINASR